MNNTSTSSLRAIKKIIPELRFPEFVKEGDWIEKELGEVALFLKGKGISKSNISKNGTLPCIRYGELYTHYNETIRIIKSYTNLNAENLVLSKASDVIIPASGETQIDIATASCVVNSGIALGGDLNIIRTKINSVFLSYYLNNAKKKEIAQMAQGISVVHLYPNQLKTLKINFPNAKEQQKLASCFSSIDEVITDHRLILDKLRDHKKGLMQNLFPQDGETVPKYRFHEFLNDGVWIEKKLGDCLFQNPQYGINAPAVPYSNKLPTYLRITDISVDGHFLSNGKVSVAKPVTEDNYLTEGDLVFARTGASVGKSYKYKNTDGRLVFAGFLIRVRPNENKLNAEFLFQFLSTNKYWKWVSFISARSGQPGINGTEYSSMPICLSPTKNEQQKIANCLSSLDELITEQSNKIEQLKLHKKGLMQGLFPKVNN